MYTHALGLPSMHSAAACNGRALQNYKWQLVSLRRHCASGGDARPRLSSTSSSWTTVLPRLRAGGCVHLTRPLEDLTCELLMVCEKQRQQEPRGGDEQPARRPQQPRCASSSSPARPPPYTSPLLARSLVLLVLAAVLCCTSSVRVPLTCESSHSGSRRQLASFPPPPAHQTRLLLFGDSLTEGVTLPGTCAHPYALELARLSGCAVSYAGYPGESSVGLGQHPLTALLKHMANQSDVPYTAAVVLVGTNDLRFLCTGPQANAVDPCAVPDGPGVSPQQLAEHIQGIHARILAVGANFSAGFKTFALAIPAPGQEVRDPPFRREHRVQVNSLLSSWAQGSPGHVFVDISALLPRFVSKPMDAHRFYDVHFTAHGYNELANVVGDALMQANVSFCPLYERGVVLPLRVTRLPTRNAPMPLCE
jgi:GDSL-like Lipase/Acylhydrolase family